MLDRIKSTYFGWWVLLGSTLLAAISSGVLLHSAPVYFNPIRRDLGLSAANTSLIFTISRAQGGGGGALFGWLADKFGGRPLIITGAILAGIGLIWIHGIQSYLPFLLIYVLVVSPGTHIGFGQTLLTVVNRWFVSRKALAMTILLVGFSAGGALFVYPIGLSVEHFGWRSTLLYSGIFVLVAGLLLSLLVRHSPERMGIVPEGMEEESTDRQDSTGARSTRESSSVDFSLSEAMHTKVFWMLLTASTLRISAETGVMVHIIPIMAWKGLDEQSAAGLVSVFFLLSIPFRLLMGISGQRLPFQPLITLGMACAVTGLILIVVTDGTWSLYPFVFLLAVYEGSVVLQWLAVGNYFGRKSFGTLTGIMRTFDTIGTLIVPFYAGRIFDVTGSYAPSIVAFAAMLAACGLLYSISRRPAARQARASQQSESDASD